MALLRREFLTWLARITAGYLTLGLRPPLEHLRRVNASLFSEAEASRCTVDTSGPCPSADVCGSDSSGRCTKDTCESDKSGDCTGDTCTSDHSGACTHDQCVSDDSLGCTGDRCDSDSTGACRTDVCESDSSGACRGDTCTGDSSGSCMGDTCVSDASGTCSTDGCEADASGACLQRDACISDRSGNCTGDDCVSDKSGSCEKDGCVSDSSYSCAADSCRADSSGACTEDECTSDSSGICENDRCQSDSSGDCTIDVCVVDASGPCGSDLCREDSTDTCAIPSRRFFANRAVRWLYRLGVALLFGPLLPDPSAAATAIDLRSATFQPAPASKAPARVRIAKTAGPFLADFDHDGILEADTDGDGLDADDPEVNDYDCNPATRELPPGTVFEGKLRYTIFYVPQDVTLTTTGPIAISSKTDARIFGVVRLFSTAQISAIGVVDARASAWLSQADPGTQSPIRLFSALRGAKDTGSLDLSGGLVPDIVDSDQDGVPDVVEEEGDGDGDGIPDSLDQDTARIASATGAGALVADVTESLRQLRDLANVAALLDTDPTLDQAGKPAGTFPWGLLSLEVTGLRRGELTPLTITFPGNVPENCQYWQYDGPGWRRVPIGRVKSHDGDTIVRIMLPDGGPWDAKRRPDQKIVHTGGFLAP